MPSASITRSNRALSSHPQTRSRPSRAATISRPASISAPACKRRVIQQLKQRPAMHANATRRITPKRVDSAHRARPLAGSCRRAARSARRVRACARRRQSHRAHASPPAAGSAQSPAAAAFANGRKPQPARRCARSSAAHARPATPHPAMAMSRGFTPSSCLAVISNRDDQTANRNVSRWASMAAISGIAARRVFRRTRRDPQKGGDRAAMNFGGAVTLPRPGRSQAARRSRLAGGEEAPGRSRRANATHRRRRAKSARRTRAAASTSASRP